MKQTVTMHYTNNKPSRLYVWTMGDGGAVRLAPSQYSTDFVMARHGNGEEIWGRWNQEIRLSAAGIWALDFGPIGVQAPIRIDIEVTGEAYPFLIPGPGLVPSHFEIPEPTLLFPAGRPIEVWTDVPAEMTMVNFTVWFPKLHPERNNGYLMQPDGQKIVPDWKCMPVIGSHYHVADTEAAGKDGWWHVGMPSAEQPIRVSVWEGLPLFLVKPAQRVPYAMLACTAQQAEDGQAMDARFTVYYHGQMIAQRDALKGETAVIPVVPGACAVRASRGIEFEWAEMAVEAAAGVRRPLPFRLRRVLSPEPGWVCGDHHMHSFFFDGVQSPERVARAARANGLSYIFLTDDHPGQLLKAGLQTHNEEGHFQAMPGTEMMFTGAHINALNVRDFVAKTGNDPEHIQMWMDAIKETATKEHPMALLLNHPAHIAKVQSRMPYFRSWWVADRLDGIDLVENFDFNTWFDRLNQGTRLPGLWTTDAHDIAFIPPGKKGSYIYVGEQLTEANILNALVEGRAFNTRLPGTLLYVRANGAMIGDTAAYDEEGKLSVQVSCQSTRPLESVELIADGKIIHTWNGNFSTRMEAEISLTKKVRWIIARAYAHVEEGCWPQDDTSMEPLLESGCIAFTNPVWVQA